MKLLGRHGRLILFLVVFFGWVDSTPLYGSVLGNLAAVRKVPFGPLPLWFLAAHAVGLVVAGYALDRRPQAASWVAAAAAAGCALLSAALFVVPGHDWRFLLAAMGLVAAGAMVSWGRWFSTAVPAAELGRVFGLTAAAVMLVGKAFEVDGRLLGPGWSLALSLLLPVSACALGFGFRPEVCRGEGPSPDEPSLWSAVWSTRSRAVGVARFALFIIFFSLVAGLSDRFFIAVPMTPYTNDTIRFLPYVGTVIAAGWLADRGRLMTPMIAGAATLAVAFLIGAWADPAAQFVGLGLNGAALGLLESAPWLLLAANARPASAGRWFGWGLNLNVVPIFLGGAVTAGFHAMQPTMLGLLAAVALLLAILSLHGVQDPLVPLRTQRAAESGKSSPGGRPVEESALERFGRQFGGLLTARELEVGELAVRGLSTRDLAKRLFISENTVKTHLRNVYRKTGTTNRGDLLRALVMAPTADVDAVSER